MNLNEDTRVKFGKKIKKLREKLGLSQDDVINIVCKYPDLKYGLLSRANLSRIECGKNLTKLPYDRLFKTLITIKEKKYYE